MQGPSEVDPKRSGRWIPKLHGQERRLEKSAEHKEGPQNQKTSPSWGLTDILKKLSVICLELDTAVGVAAM